MLHFYAEGDNYYRYIYHKRNNNLDKTALFLGTHSKFKPSFNGGLLTVRYLAVLPRVQEDAIMPLFGRMAY